MTHAEMVEKIAREYAAHEGCDLSCFAEKRASLLGWCSCADDSNAAISNAARAGYVLVPLEATEEMIEAGMLEVDQLSAAVIYSRMIAARPGQEKEDV